MPANAAALAVGVATAAAAALLASVPATAAAAAGHVKSVECAACKVLAKDLVELGENATDVTKVIAELQAACDKKLANHTAEMKVCEDIVAGLVEMLPFVDNQIAQLAWDSANLCAIAGVCKVNCCVDPRPTQPEQLHIALTRDPTEMSVMWTTLDDTPTHLVRWGTDATNLSSTSANGTSSTYTHFGWVGHLHRARITGLAPGQQYFYSVGTDGGLFSKVFSFTTLHADAGSAARPLRVASIGDMGYGDSSDDTVARLTELVDAGDLDMVIHNGDISYADGEFGHWDVFMRKVEPVAARVPYQVTPGNHEFWFNFSAYKHRFSMPDDGAHDNHFYGFAVGAPDAAAGGNFSELVHFVAMDTESFIDVAYMSPAQVRWHEQELAAAAQHARWVVAYGHRPLYCSNTGGQDIPQGNKVLREAIEAQLQSARVDLVIEAHVHDYERSFPVYNETLVSTSYADAKAPVYVVNGAAGNREGNDHPPGNSSRQDYWPGSLNRTNVTSYGVFTVAGDTLAWRQFAAADNSLVDAFNLTKTPTVA